jgi:hypothetical protein
LPQLCQGTWPSEKTTYDIWSGLLPTAVGSPIADRLNTAIKYVVTHRPESLECGPFVGLRAEIVEDIRRIKSQRRCGALQDRVGTLLRPASRDFGGQDKRPRLSDSLVQFSDPDEDIPAYPSCRG